MKGWLEKYNDGGPVQPNYNNASVTLSDNFVGEGIINGPNFKNPAWGGQFDEGGEVPATKQDSLNLYNNAKKVLDYYNSKKYNKIRESYYPIPDSDYNKDIHNENLKTFKEFVHFNKPGFAPPRVPLKSNSSANVVIPESMYYKKLDDNKYMQRESANAILDTRAPMQLFDKRIAPSVYRGFINKDINDIMEGDAVSLYGYDPILVKPESMLTPQERALRIKRYGEYSGLSNATHKVTPKHQVTMAPVSKKPTQPVIYQKPEPTPQSTIDFMDGNYGQEPIIEIPQPQSQVSVYGEVVDPRTGYTHMTRQGSAMYPLVGQRVPEMAMGGSLPGSVGFTYARTNDPAPSEGPYAKKTMASAQNGTEMEYYQNGLDWKPKTISRDGSQLVKLDQLTNFTNYNTKQPGGWLDKYSN